MTEQLLRMSLVYIPLSDSGQQISKDSLVDSVCICTCVRALLCVCVCVCECCMSISLHVVRAVTDVCIRKLVKMSQRRKQLNSISAAAFTTTGEPANGVRNLKSWEKISLRKFSLPGKEVSSLRLFLYCMIVKAPLFRALLLLCELKCRILVCAPPMRGKALQKLEEGYVKFSGNVFLSSFQPTFS